MARRRMFSLDVVDTDKFLDLPISAQCLYFHLGMRADDDGFITSMRKIITYTGSSNDDLRRLIDGGFVIAFESGVYVISDWKISNYIPGDRYHQTVCRAERDQLEITPTGAYQLKATSCIHPVDNPVNNMDTEDREGEERLGEERLGEGRAGEKPAPSADLSPISETEIAREREIVDLLQSYGIRATPRDTKDAHDLIDQYGRKTFEEAAEIAMKRQKAAVPYIRGILKNGGGTHDKAGNVRTDGSAKTGGAGADRREKARWHVSNCV